MLSSTGYSAKALRRISVATKRLTGLPARKLERLDRAVESNQVLVLALLAAKLAPFGAAKLAVVAKGWGIGEAFDDFFAAMADHHSIVLALLNDGVAAALC